MLETELQQVGIEASRSGRHQEAIAIFQRLVEIKPAEPVYYANLGLACVHAGQLAAAISSYRAAVSLRPHHAPTLAKLARVLASTGDPDEALATFRRALAVDPGNPDTWNALGAFTAGESDFESAAAMFRRALEIDPSHEEARENLTASLLKMGEAAAARENWTEALNLFCSAAATSPGNFDCHYDQAIALVGLNRLEEAEGAYRAALSIQPGNAKALNNLGHVLLARGKADDAVASLEMALASDPGYLDALYNLGATRQQQGRFSEAFGYYEKVLAANPNHSDTHSNLGSMLLAQARPVEAIPHFDRAIQIAPDHYDARWNRALSLLSCGNYRDGWKAYEVRLSRKNSTVRHNTRPRWQGEPIAGRSVLVWAEQGLGDTIQFLRFLQPVRELGAQVIFECQDRVMPLAACVPAIQLLVNRGAPLPTFDYQLPLMSLPATLNTDIGTLPPPTQIQIPADRLSKWSHVSGKTDRIGNIGLCWAGNHHHPTGTSREVPLEAFSQLTALSDYRFYSLQRGPKENLEGAAKLGIHNIEAEENDILDTAAIIHHLDLVITVDTMIAHLAASLGKPTWILLPFAADWRWLVERADSPWYPTAHLFRQKQANDWVSAISAVRQALQQQRAMRG